MRAQANSSAIDAVCARVALKRVNKILCVDALFRRDAAGAPPDGRGAPDCRQWSVAAAASWARRLARRRARRRFPFRNRPARLPGGDACCPPAPAARQRLLAAHEGSQRDAISPVAFGPGRRRLPRRFRRRRRPARPGGRSGAALDPRRPRRVGRVLAPAPQKRIGGRTGGARRRGELVVRHGRATRPRNPWRVARHGGRRRCDRRRSGRRAGRPRREREPCQAGRTWHAPEGEPAESANGGAHQNGEGSRPSESRHAHQTPQHGPRFLGCPDVACHSNERAWASQWHEQGVQRARDPRAKRARDVGVASGGSDAGVPEQQLYVADVGPIFQQMGRERVPEQVRRDFAA